MSHSHRPAQPARRRAAPGTAEDEPRARRPAEPGARRPPESGMEKAEKVAVRTAELTACCVTSFAVSIVALVVLLGVFFIGYKMFG